MPAFQKKRVPRTQTTRRWSLEFEYVVQRRRQDQRFHVAAGKMRFATWYVCKMCKMYCCSNALTSDVNQRGTAMVVQIPRAPKTLKLDRRASMRLLANPLKKSSFICSPETFRTTAEAKKRGTLGPMAQPHIIEALEYALDTLNKKADFY